MPEQRLKGLIRRTWTWRLDQPPNAVWPVLSDTARLNEAAGLPIYQLEETARADGSVSRIGRARIGVVDLEWEELPVEWVQNRRFRQMRVFSKGPFRRFGLTVELEPDGQGTRASYTFEGEPRGILGRLLVGAGLFERTGRTFGRLVASAGSFLSGGREVLFDSAALAPGAAERIEALAERIEAGSYGHGLAQRLAAHVIAAQEVDLARIRPLALARQWGADPRAVIELCLEAARVGLLRLSWGLLCPRCRGAKEMMLALDQLPHGVHCPSCNIDFDSDFSRNVEASFQPAATVRQVADGGFCLSGPQTTPHVVAQQSLEPNERREVAADLTPGEYRLRTLEPGGQSDMSFKGGCFPAVVADGYGVAPGGVAPGELAPSGRIVFINQSQRRLTLVVESRAWVGDALTAHRLSTLQAFRDLFPGQALRAGENMSIDNVALMFTDLEGSTALYRRIGDGPAYRLVREHFAFLADIVRRHEGAVVKTIGDAVMAAFSDPAKAVAAALAVQHKVADFNAAQPGPGVNNGGIIIKMGLHMGPCIVVTLNGRLDYFGTTVNLAARLQGQSGGGDVVVSEPLAVDPEVARRLAPYRASAENAALKGFDSPIPFRRLRHADILAVV